MIPIAEVAASSFANAQVIWSGTTEEALPQDGSVSSRHHSVVPTRSTARGLLTVILLVVGVACGADDVDDAGPGRATTTSRLDVQMLDGVTPIGFDGIGPIRAGMTIAEAEEASGRPMIIIDFESFGGHCYFAHPEGMKEDVLLTVLSPDEQPVTNPKDGVVGRASFEEGITSSPAETIKGPGIGSSADDVRSVYREFGIAESTHHYIDGLYLDVKAPGSDRLLRFETDADGRVFVIHGGAPDAVRLVEGCA